MVLVNYYAPNAENEQVKVLIQIKNILDNLEISQDTSVILGGDFNLFFFWEIAWHRRWESVS